MLDDWWIVLLVLLGLALVIQWQFYRRRLHQAERAYRQAERSHTSDLESAREQILWLEAAVESSSEILLVVDPELQVRFANDRAVEVFGERQQPITLLGFSRSTELEQLAAEVQEAADPEGYERVVTISEKPYRVWAVAQGANVSLSMVDISETMRLSRARQDMVANLSHELRTPLTSLRLLVDTLVSPTRIKPEVANQLIEKLASEIDTLEQISQEMLDLAAIESGRQVIRLVPERLMDILEIPLARLEDQAARKNLSLRVSVTPDWIVLADRDQASRAVLNVLHNAIKFSPSGGMVRIEAEEDVVEEKIVLRVQDSGEGIPPSDLARIFERFYRGDRARQTPGTGLGLAIARHIMQAHGGRIWAENLVPPERGVVVFLAFEPG